MVNDECLEAVRSQIAKDLLHRLISELIVRLVVARGWRALASELLHGMVEVNRVPVYDRRRD